LILFLWEKEKPETNQIFEKQKTPLTGGETKRGLETKSPKKFTPWTITSKSMK